MSILNSVQPSPMKAEASVPTSPVRAQPLPKPRTFRKRADQIDFTNPSLSSSVASSVASSPKNHAKHDLQQFWQDMDAQGKLSLLGKRDTVEVKEELVKSKPLPSPTPKKNQEPPKAERLSTRDLVVPSSTKANARSDNEEQPLLQRSVPPANIKPQPPGSSECCCNIL
jgi:hypothetical protein